MLSKWLVSNKGLRRIVLATYGLYAQFGFESVPNPEVLMQGLATQCVLRTIHNSSRIDVLSKWVS
ncbi:MULTISPECIES: hypothetical protein [Shewanella]|uniref:hypothetical protein n=1 Tax=Shewanella TaxID=22 RepID=UPI00163D5D30|nr:MULTISPECIES: hypothetical protein [Shewanella]